MLQVTPMNPAAYRQYIKALPRYFYNQTVADLEEHQQQGREAELLSVKREETTILACKVVYLPTGKWYRIASINWLPVDHISPEDFSLAVTALLDYFRQRHSLVIVRISPLLVEAQLLPDGTEKREPQAAAYGEALHQLGFEKLNYDLYTEASVQPQYLYVLPLTGRSEKEVFASLDRRVRSHMRVCTRYGMTLRYLEASELSYFNTFLREMQARKEISERVISYAGDHIPSYALYPAAFLRAQDGIEQNEKLLADLNAQIDALASREDLSKKDENKIMQLEQQKQGSENRLERLAEIPNKEQELCLAVSEFCLTPSDYICLQTAVADDYVDLSPTYLIHECMLKKAIQREAAYYNFFAVSDPHQEGDDAGVLGFKEQFNGYIEQYIGTYDYVLKKPWLLTLLGKM